MPQVTSGRLGILTSHSRDFLPNCSQLVRLQNSFSQEKGAAHFGALSVYWSLSHRSRCMREHDAMLRVLFTKPGEPATLPSSVKQL
jgi:hypothetical protein